MLRPGLHPPRPTMRIDDDSLSRPSVSDAPGDLVSSLPATLCGWKDPGELDGGAGTSFLGVATMNCKTGDQMRASAKFFGARLATHRAVPREYLLASMSDPKLLGLMIPSLGTLNKRTAWVRRPQWRLQPLYQIGGPCSIQLALRLQF
jgi:hypothetical protein